MSMIARGAVSAAMLLFGFVACSSSRDAFVEQRPLVDPSDAGNDAAPAACAGRRCSRDLHQVLDGCTGEVVEECPADQACGTGKCMLPCDAASVAQGSIGCSFWTTPPDMPAMTDVSCFAAFVANTWSTPATLKASFGSEPLDVSKSVYRAVSEGARVRYERIDGPVPPGEVGIVFLSQGIPGPNHQDWIACPSGVQVAYTGTVVSEHRTSIYKAFHLETDVPVSAYSIFPYGGANSYVPSATLLLPVSSWSTSYLLVDGYETDPFIQIVAQEDDTIVRMKPRADISAGLGVAGAPAGMVGSWTLQRGQVLELVQPTSIAGTPLESTKPVGIFGGARCIYIPSDVPACDVVHQQIPPLQQWGRSYSGVPYKTRRVAPQAGATVAERVYWRIAGARDGTSLSWFPGRPDGAPAKLASGELVFFTTDKPFTVQSQDAEHPIYLAAYMTGGTFYSTAGDPEFVNVVPDEQFLDDYVFFVDFTYASSTLTVVRRRDAGGFHPVEVDCLGAVEGWQPLDAEGTIEYAWVDITKARAPVTTPKGSCTYGRHEARSDGPFALYVWGTDDFASYGFPAGAGSRPTSPFTIAVR